MIDLVLVKNLYLFCTVLCLTVCSHVCGLLLLGINCCTKYWWLLLVYEGLDISLLDLHILSLCGFG